MATYLSTVNVAQMANINYIIKRMNEKGLTNHLTQAGILGVSSKESAFLPKEELSYRNTSNDRIRAIFGGRVAGLSEDQLTLLKANDNNFFDQVYGFNCELGRSMGNIAPGDGFKFRGRGFNQVTFKNLYKKYGTLINVDLITNPGRLNEIPVAADVLIQYFIESFKACPKAVLAAYHTTGLNDFKTIQDAAGAIYHANAGWGKSLAKIAADPTGGRAKTLARAPEFYNLINQQH